MGTTIFKPKCIDCGIELFGGDLCALCCENRPSLADRRNRRERIATAVFTSIVTTESTPACAKHYAENALIFADALIKELDK